MLSVNEELERLVKVGELAKVAYKGSFSFRIVNKDQTNEQGIKHKRQKKSTLVNTSVKYCKSTGKYFISNGGQLPSGPTSTLSGIADYRKILLMNVSIKRYCNA